MRKQIILILILGGLFLGLAACAPQRAPAAGSRQPAAPATAIVPAATEIAETEAPPTPEPAPTDTSKTDPYQLAYELMAGAAPTVPDGWSAAICDGSGGALCLTEDGALLGIVSLELFPLKQQESLRAALREAGYDPDLPPQAGDGYRAAALAGLVKQAGEHWAIISADRRLTFPDDRFTPFEPAPAPLGQLTALTFGFSHENRAGETVEVVHNLVGFDENWLYWLSAAYGGEASFTSPETLARYLPHFIELGASLPLPLAVTHGASSSAELPKLPPFYSANYIPPDPLAGVPLTLDADFPTAPENGAVLSQVDPNSRPLSAAEAAALVEHLGFTGRLYREYLPDAPTQERYVAFGGTQTLGMNGAPYTIVDAAAGNPLELMGYEDAAPIAAAALQERGLLDFPYRLQPGENSRDVYVMRLVDGRPLPVPEFSVAVARSGIVAQIAYNPQVEIETFATYPLLPAETVWQAFLADRAGTLKGTAIRAPVGEPPAPTMPQSYWRRTFLPGDNADVSNLIWAYLPVDGEGAPHLLSDQFYEIRGAETMLAVLSQQAATLVRLQGTVLEEVPGVPLLRLEHWEPLGDAGSVPQLDGTIRRDGNGTSVEINGGDSLPLIDPPAGLEDGAPVAISGWAETEGLNWQEISLTVAPAGSIEWATPAPLESVNFDSVEMVYYQLPAYQTGLAENLFVPAWAFTGTGNDGLIYVVTIPAVPAHYFASGS